MQGYGTDRVRRGTQIRQINTDEEGRTTPHIPVAGRAIVVHGTDNHSHFYAASKTQCDGP